MREIKFRGWHNGYPQTGYLPATKPVMMYDAKHGDCLRWKSEGQPIDVMQYTGIKDKNGKDIYEGDIVRILYSEWPSKSASDSRTMEQYLKDIANINVVVYEYNGFYVSHKVGGYCEDMNPGKHGYIEVIGNIYETPELLTGEPTAQASVATKAK